VAAGWRVVGSVRTEITVEPVAAGVIHHKTRRIAEIAREVRLRLYARSLAQRLRRERIDAVAAVR
jgi:hypothetical protein